MVYINRIRPTHNDRTARAVMRGRSERLERQRPQFVQYMHETGLDDAAIERELRRFDEIVAQRRLAGDTDEG